LRLFVLALWAMAISTGVITVLKFMTGCTAIDLTAKRLCSATFNSQHSLAVTEQ
jgi:hypothetical protein